MKYQLKDNQPVFECTDGKFRHRMFIHGITYTEIPLEESHRFEEITGRKEPEYTLPEETPAEPEPEKKNGNEPENVRFPAWDDVTTEE